MSKKMKEKYFAVFLVFTIIAATANAYAQQYGVKGTITASGSPVKYAAVTFTDNSNSSVVYTAVTDSTGVFDLGTVTGVKQNPHSQLPASFQLEQNYPNPFASRTAISYNLDKKSDVRVTIYDVLGRVVRRYSMGSQDAGVHGIIWNGRDMMGRIVAPGVYFYRLQARGRSEVRKMLFGIGAPHASVSLTGKLPSATEEAGAVGKVDVQGESFTVRISNTDSTNPFIAPTQFSYIRISSDTNMTFAGLQELNPAVVYSDSTAQLIEGFGAANIVGWNPGLNYGDMTTAELQTAYGDGPGQIGLTIMRVRIPPDSTQFAINVPSGKFVDGMGGKIIATPWTPPAWMKTNNSTVAGSIKTDAFAAFAAHLKAFADTMAAHGAPVYAVSVQNEPDAKVNYESCYWSPTDFLDFMKSYAPQVGVPVFMPESESFNTSFSDPTLNDSVANSHVAFVAGHLYGAKPFKYSLALEKGKQVWMTEYLYNNQTWSGVMSTAKQINDCMYDDMSAYVRWWMVRFYSLIGDGTNGSQAGVVTKRGYVMSQYARFVRPGYFRVHATGNPQPNLYMTAYKGSGKTVIVVVNMNSNSMLQPITLNNSAVSSFTPYVTSATKNCEKESSVNVTNGQFTPTLDASSVTTFVSN